MDKKLTDKQAKKVTGGAGPQIMTNSPDGNPENPVIRCPEAGTNPENTNYRCPDAGASPENTIIRCPEINGALFKPEDVGTDKNTLR